MKRKITLFISSCLMAIGAMAENVCISTSTSSLVVDATKGKELKFVYYGAKLTAADLKTVGEFDINGGGYTNFAAYPTYGFNCDKEYALSVVHANGDMALQLQLESSETRADGTTVFKMKDKVQPLYVNVCYRVRPASEIIETWTEITNQEKKAVRLTRFDSGSLLIRRGNVWVSHLYGSWANEGMLCEEPLNAGMLVIENKDGVRNSHTSHGEIMISLDGKPRENSGDVIGAAICYTGNYKLRLNTHDDEFHQLFAGINEEASEYQLAKGETFTTPVQPLTTQRNDDGTVTATMTVVNRYAKGEMATAYSCTMDSQGNVDFQATYTPSGELPPLPCMGNTFTLPKQFTRVEWYGMGPYDTYPDRLEAAHIGLWSSTVDQQYVHYPRPQDSGNHQQTVMVKLTDNKGKGWMITAEDGQHFSFSALPYSIAQLSTTAHDCDLVAEDNVYLNIDAAVMGIGNSSCGPGVLSQYAIAQKPHTLHLRFTKLK